MSEVEMDEVVIRGFLEEGQRLHREYMASKDRDERRDEAPRLVVAWVDLRLQLREGLPSTAQKLLDKLYSNFTEDTAPCPVSHNFRNAGWSHVTLEKERKEV